MDLCPPMILFLEKKKTLTRILEKKKGVVELQLSNAIFG